MFTKQCAVKVKAVGENDNLDEGVFEAIVSVFGNVDSYGDRVMKGAFTDTLKEWEASGDPIPVYWSHRMDDPDFNIGHVLEAKETDEGLWIKAQIDLEGSKAQQVYRLLKGRRVTQFSFAYDIEAYQIVKTADDAESVWELQKLKLYEVGPTPIGANQETELLTVKAAGHQADRLSAEIKAGRVISAKNESELKSARDAIDRVLSALESTDDDEAKSGEPANAEEPEGASAEEPMRKASALSLQAEIALRDLEMLTR